MNALRPTLTHVFPTRLDADDLPHAALFTLAVYAPLPDECALCMAGVCQQMRDPAYPEVILHGTSRSLA